MSATDAAIAWLAGQQRAQAVLLDGMDGPAWLVDGRQLAVLHANADAARWLGLPSADGLVGALAATVLPSFEDAAFWAAVEAGQTACLASDIELTHPDGSPAIVHRRVSPLWVDSPQAGRVVSSWLISLRDISAERAAQREREQALAELRATLEATADGILVQDLHGHVRAFNRRFAAQWQLPDSATARGQDEAVRAWMRHCVLEPEAYDRRLREIEQQPLLPAIDQLTLLDGSVIERHSQPQWQAGRPIGRVSTFRLLNERRLGAPRPRGAEGEDPRVGCPNRTLFLQAVQHAVQASRADGGGLVVMAVAFDDHALFALDGEAAVRDLRELALVLAAHAVPQGQVASLGGGRFGVLLPGASEEAAEALARRLHEGLSHSLPALPSAVGVAAFPQAGLDAATLLWQAEAGLGEALRDPSAQRWRVQRYIPEAHGGLASGLLEAVHNGQFSRALRLRYLPSVATGSGRIVAAEALVRWIDPLRGEVPPAPWWPHLVRAGLAGAVDDWVLAEAVQQGVRWRASGWTVRLAVNVGAAQMAQPGYARRVATVLEQAKWPADLLALDVTAAALQADPLAAEANARALRELGVRLVLDDTGAAELPLALLRRLPLTGVKLDASLWVGVPQQPAAVAVVRALHALANALGLVVDAEGIETETQRALVAELGCHAWQGRLHGPPQPPDALLQQARTGAQ
ncbi:MAG: EAL domain-containing protein [Proteobacteria bacterium]|nr:EAL domain-containing protein [Pseudomonadota bacterium]